MAKKGFQGAVLGLLGASEHRATVRSVRPLTASMTLVDFHSDTLLEAEENPATWVRAWFPDPAGGDRLHQRGYTLLDPDPAAGTFTIAFVLHEPAGPASHWARRAAEGQELLMMRYGGDGFTPHEHTPRGQLLVGDAASWPAISAIAGSLPADLPVEIIMERHRPEDEDLPLPRREGLEVRWVEPRGDDALAAAVAQRDHHGWATWVAAETRATKAVRRELKSRHGQNRSTMHAQAYWIRGRAMGKHADPEQRTGG